MFSTKLENKRVELVMPGSGGEMGGEKLAQIMYTYVSKCKNDKVMYIYK
jgi:hypothetical protein